MAKTSHELARELLAGPDLLMICSGDAEGNRISELHEITEEFYRAEFRDIKHPDDADDEDIKVLVLWPV